MWTDDFNLRATDGVFDSRTDDGGLQRPAGTTIVGAEMNAQNSGLPWTTEADLLQLNTNAQDATTTTRPGLQQRLFEIRLPVDRMRREILADPARDDMGEHN